jgi:hypothetical protein
MAHKFMTKICNKNFKVFVILAVGYETMAWSCSSAAAPQLMTKSTSPAAGMIMSSKYTYFEQYHFLSANPVTSLRNDTSTGTLGLNLGTETLTRKSSASETANTGTPTIMSGKLGFISAEGIRFGASIDAGDYTVTRKTKTSRTSTSSKSETSIQNLGVYAAAGFTANFGASLGLTMVDVKDEDSHDNANVVTPGVMVMTDSTEFVVDLVQAIERVDINGHWRLGVNHRLESGLFATGELVRVQPYLGEDFWGLAAGARKKSSAHSSMGAEFVYNQRWDVLGLCASPSTYGVRGDIDHELSSDKVLSAGAQFLTGSCTVSGDTKLSKMDLLFNGSFTFLF